MGFWKSLFSSSDAAAASRSPKGDAWVEDASKSSAETLGAGNPYSSTYGVSDYRQGTRILFSTERDIDLYELEELCDAVGWSRRPMRKVKKAIQYSFLVVSMWQVRGTQRRLVGFARATSDHAFNATLWDVVVHPDCQGKGLGKAMMKYIIKKLRSEDISNITLFADPHVLDFYRGMGFIADPEGIRGMFWYPD
jgi:ribosomal protein S18 acetylase RimI-like enzyme